MSTLASLRPAHRVTLADAAAAPPLQFVSEMPSYLARIDAVRALLGSTSLAPPSPSSSPSLSRSSSITTGHAMVPRERAVQIAWTGTHPATRAFRNWCAEHAPGVHVPRLLDRLGSGDGRGGVRVGDLVDALDAELNLCRVWNRLAPGAASTRASSSDSTGAVAALSATAAAAATAAAVAAGGGFSGGGVAGNDDDDAGVVTVQMSAFIVLLRQPEVAQDRALIELLAGACVLACIILRCCVLTVFFHARCVVACVRRVA